jgi:PAS domain S-box-containing protein
MPYEEYFKAATEGLIIVDRGGQIVEVNPRTERLFGYSEQELLGRQIESLVPPQLRQLHGKHVQDYFAQPRTRAMGRGLSLAGRRKDGSEFPIEISLTYACGTSRGDLVVAAVVDISERLALEHEVRRAETLTSLGTLAAGIAHDLNNPLQVIRSRSELLLESPDTTPASEMRDDFVTIQRQARRASAIIEEFLGLARQREKILAPVDINDLIERALLLIGEQMRKVGIELATRLDPSLPKIVADATGLERVLINLLTNARDAMPQGGAVVIASSLLTESQQWLQVSVADDGPGIPPDALPKLFNILYTTKSNGSGLGLWLSRRIIQEHGGKLEARSEIGKGTTFTIRLPTHQSAD